MVKHKRHHRRDLPEDHQVLPQVGLMVVEPESIQLQFMVQPLRGFPDLPKLTPVK